MHLQLDLSVNNNLSGEHLTGAEDLYDIFALL